MPTCLTIDQLGCHLSHTHTHTHTPYPLKVDLSVTFGQALHNSSPQSVFFQCIIEDFQDLPPPPLTLPQTYLYTSSPEPDVLVLPHHWTYLYYPITGPTCITPSLDPLVLPHHWTYLYYPITGPTCITPSLDPLVLPHHWTHLYYPITGPTRITPSLDLLVLPHHWTHLYYPITGPTCIRYKCRKIVRVMSYDSPPDNAATSAPPPTSTLQTLVISGIVKRHPTLHNKTHVHGTKNDTPL